MYHLSEMKYPPLAIVLSSLLAVAGCYVPPGPGQPGGPPGQADVKNVELERIEAELSSANARLTELGRRSDRLAEKVNELGFVTRQLRAQLKAVGDAPRMRDHYKRLLAESQLENETLKRHIAELEKRAGGATTAPAPAPPPAVEGEAP